MIGHQKNRLRFVYDNKGRLVWNTAADAIAQKFSSESPFYTPSAATQKILDRVSFLEEILKKESLSLSP